MVVIVVSKQDLAGLTIKEQLIKRGKFKESDQEFEGNTVFEDLETQVPLVTINRRLIEADHLDHLYKTDLLIFASKHKSESEKPSLLVHAPGNWTTDNSFGGNQHQLALTSAVVIKRVLNKLTKKREESQLSYDVTSEVTHHGPTNLKSPCVFIELGSNEMYWQDPKGAQIVAKTILEIIRSPSKSDFRYAIGFGGPHYASNFNKVQLYTDFAVSHIASKYVLDKITEDIIKQAINKTVEDVKYAILDWKGMVSAQRERIIPILTNLGMEILKVRKVLANSN